METINIDMQNEKVQNTQEQKERRQNNLESFFKPKSIAVFGATDAPDKKTGEPKLGQRMAENIMESYGQEGNTYYFVNPGRDEAFGKKVYHSIAELPETPDLAVVVTPAGTVPQILRECIAKEVPSVVVLSAGFGENGNDEEKKEGERLAEEFKNMPKGKTRIAGPNCFGVVGEDANATFSPENPLRGDVGYISQSGGVLAAGLDNKTIGISRAVSTGAMFDVSWAEWMENFGNDQKTNKIVVYMEGIGDNARGFISNAREATMKGKLIIALKGGRTKESVEAISSHTGAMAGEDDIYDAMFEKAGILRAEDSQEMLQLLEMAKQPLPKGNRLAMITNGGGAGVLATDKLVQNKGKLAKFSDVTVKKLDEALPSTASKHNPIDVIGDATPERYRASIEAALEDEGNDGVQVTYVPVRMSKPEDVAQIIIDAHKKYPGKQ